MPPPANSRLADAPLTRNALVFAATANVTSWVAIDKSFPACSLHSNAVAR